MSTAGIVVLSAAALAAAGWPLDQLDPAQIHAWRDGREVPLEIVSSSGQLQALRLAVAPSASRWTDTAVYWLSVEPKPGRRAAVPATTQGWTWDADQVYLSAWPTLRGDRWWSAELRRGAARSLVLDLPAAAPAGSVLELAVRTTGAGGQLQLAVEGQVLGAPVVGSAQALTLTFMLDRALPVGAHTLTLLSSAPDPVLVDQLSLPGLAVPLPQLPEPELQRHTPATALGTGDTLLIAHASLRSALPQLVAAHQALGEQVQVVDVQAAYDLYSWGERSPEAIRNYIRFATARWTPAPQRVLLVGAGTVALRGAPPAGRETLIPPYLTDTDPRGEVTCDSCYGRVVASDPRDQLVPDLAVGRLPARSLAEAQALVNKTVAALVSSPGRHSVSPLNCCHRVSGGHRVSRLRRNEVTPGVTSAGAARALLLTDNDRQADGTPDPAGSFVATSEAVAAALPGWDLARLYYAPERPAGGPFDPDVGQLRCQLFRLLDGGNPADPACPPLPATLAPGAALWVYAGHGSPWQWGSTTSSAPVPYLFYLYDADGRRAAGTLPILLSLTCLSGDWANPTLETTEERLLRWSAGGTVASLGSSGLGVNDGHAVFGAAVAHALAQGAELGNAHLAGLRAVTADGAHQDLAYAFSILGDPSVRLPWRPLHQLWLPEVRRVEVRP
ncbi:MAG TPA: C25 family cysteine peptidase [Roseiflexaceae bacterium]|nr:C25 family cysteine peptidase [Roseiflexaceae bacterium]